MASSSRLTRALDAGMVVLPDEGRVGMWNARPEDVVLPVARLHAVQPLRPLHDALCALGVAAAPHAAPPYALAHVRVGRSRVATLGQVAEALAAVPPGALVLIDGQKEDGIEGILAACRREIAVGEPLSKGHGKLFAVARPEMLPRAVADWAEAARPRRGPDGLIRRAGGFSADGPDRGSLLLAGFLPRDLGGHVADLGAGAGTLAAAVLASPGVTRLDLVEADALALEDARANVTDPRAHFLWEDAAHWRPESVCDAVVCNPPFHTGRAADPGLGRAFIRSAAAALAPGGGLWMVANRHLPYEGVLAESFGDVARLADAGGFKVFRARRPLATGRGMAGRGVGRGVARSSREKER